MYNLNEFYDAVKESIQLQAPKPKSIQLCSSPFLSSNTKNGTRALHRRTEVIIYTIRILEGTLIKFICRSIERVLAVETKPTTKSDLPILETAAFNFRVIVEIINVN